MDQTGAAKTSRRFRTGKQGYAIVDAEDWPRVAMLSWYKMKGGYVICGTRSVGKVMLHRLVLNYFGHLHVDHINHKPWDNRKANLRIVEPYVNCANRKGPQSDNTSGYLGVAPSIWGWHAYKTIRRKRYHLGYYKTPRLAYLARKKWKFGDPLPRKLKRSNNTTGCRGVTRKKTGYYNASVQLKGVRYGLGCFKRLKDAVAARKLCDERLRLGWVIRLTSCGCGGRFAWFELTSTGAEICRGCLCHATRNGVRRIGAGTVGRDWSMEDSEPL